jgi:cell division protein FtsB
VAQRRTPAAAGVRQRRRGALTGRAAVLGLVVSALVLTLAYPARTYLLQQAEISERQQEIALQKERIAELEERNAKWEDKAYVMAQARERLQLVLPGQVGYVILHPESNEDTEQTAAPVRARLDGPWYGKLWSAVRAADRPVRVPPAPGVPLLTPAPR